MANVDPSLYPKDLTMSLESNHVQNEVKEFNNAEDRIFVPNGGPFYTDSLLIKHGTTGELLKPHTQFQLLYLHETATQESNKDVVSVIRILDETIPSVKLEYRVIGGEYGNTYYGIIQELTKSGPIKKNVDWNVNVFNKPVVFPPAPHFHTPDSFTGWDMIYTQLDGIRKAIIRGDEPSWASVYRYIDRYITNSNSNIVQTIKDITNKVDNRYSNEQIDKKIRDATADNTYVTTQTLGTQLDNYYIKSETYTKEEVDNKVSIVDNNFTNYYNKQELDRKIKVSDPAFKQNVNLSISLSSSKGNLLEKRSDGLYYGIEAPPDLSNLYVDAVGGLDTNPGTKLAPLKTLDKALEKVSATMSNTIHLKHIPDEHKDTHDYFISNEYTIANGATRRITQYGHPMIDGDQFERAVKLTTNKYWFFASTVPTVNVWVRWIKKTATNGFKYQTNASFILADGKLLFDKINLVLSQPVDTATYKVNNDYRAVIIGYGNVTINGSVFTRVTSDDTNKDNTDVSLRPAMNDPNVNSTYWFKSRDGLLSIIFNSAMFTYGTSTVKDSVNEHGYSSYGNVTSHNVYNTKGFNQINERAFKGKQFVDIQSGTLSITDIEQYTWEGERKLNGIDVETKLASNVKEWFSNSEVIHNVQYQNGVPTNVSANFQIGSRNISNNPNTYRVQTVTTLLPSITLRSLLGWNDDTISDTEYRMLMTGMLYCRLINTPGNLKTVNIDIPENMFPDFDPKGLQVTFFNANNLEINVNQTIGGVVKTRVWLPYTAITVVFVNATTLDIIGGIIEE